ncbi:Rid family hydrolase [Demequina globuliformis]|uniref:Rid family hydrolase n=1 Tax=Demequina globuliformis TaxID=676202 RepID=UPI0007838DBA|nr:Rid family hydrolase [Demequina globuliformis]
MRQNIDSGGQWEDSHGYSRAVRVGSMVWVAGTIAGPAALEEGPEGQTADALARIERALEEAGASLHHVVRTVVYVVDIEETPAISRAHRRAFGGIRPVSTLVEVSALADPRAVVEIQADAVIA